MTDAVAPQPSPMPADPAVSSTVDRILVAARECLGTSGFAAFSTRAVADRADVPLSQIHYHFRSKQQLILRLLEEENRALVERQRAMFAGPAPFAEKWDRACDYLEADLGSGYVRRLHELFANGYADPVVAAALRSIIGGWLGAIAELAETSLRPGTLAGIGQTPASFAALAASAFIGAESFILIALSEEAAPNRLALRQLGRWIARLDAEGASSISRSDAGA